MILHSIRVENWRCFLTPVTVGPLDEGLNVIYAPNGSGKSKLFEALHRTLLDSHRVTGQGILSVQPWGRLLPPRVCLEFTEGRATYRLTKQFLHAPSALLERRENGHYVRLAQGDPVDDLVREMLSSDATGRRLTKQQHWGIAQVLWAPQGELRFGELSDSLITNIRASLSAQMTGARGLAIQRRMEALYGQYFTPTGKARSGRGSRLVQLQERLAAAEETLDLGRALHEQFEDTVEKIADLTERSQAAHHHVVELEQQVDLLKAKAEDHHGLVAEKERWSERVTAISSKLDALQQRIKRASASTARVRRAQQTLGELSGSRLEVASESETLTAAEAEAQAALESARAEQDALAGLRERAQAAVDLCNARLDQENLETLISRIQEARRVAEECSSCAADLAAPGAEDLAKIRRAVRQRDEAQVRLEASLLHLELTPEKHGHLEIISGDRSGEHLMLEPGHAVRVDGSPGVEVAVDGLGHIRAWGPDGSSDEHRSALAEAVSGLAGLTEPYGTDDETELERLNERSRTLEAKASNARSRLEALLDGKRIEDLLEEAKSKAATLHSILESYPEWVESPPDADVLGDELRREE